MKGAGIDVRRIVGLVKGDRVAVQLFYVQIKCEVRSLLRASRGREKGKASLRRENYNHNKYFY